MIYTRWGNTVSLVAYCGKHVLKGYSEHPVMLVRVKYDDGHETHQFAHALRADGGINEIEDAIDTLPELTLTGAVLRQALREAE